jgi:hypothetical protein
MDNTRGIRYLSTRARIFSIQRIPAKTVPRVALVMEEARKGTDSKIHRKKPGLLFPMDGWHP